MLLLARMGTATTLFIRADYPSLQRFYAGLNKEQGKSKAYFHVSYNRPPNKSVVNGIMDKLSYIIATKCTPLTLLVGDHLAYVIITLLKAENQKKYRDSVPFFGLFHKNSVQW